MTGENLPLLSAADRPAVPALPHVDCLPDHEPSPDIEMLANRLRKGMPSNLSRRGLIGFGGALLAHQIISSVEGRVMDDHYRSTGTEILFPEACDFDPSPESIALASPGYGSDNGSHIVEQLVKYNVYPEKFPLGYYSYASRNFTVDDIIACSRQMARKHRPNQLDVHGISEGGPIGLLGILGAKTEARLITTNDSPFDINDAQDALLAKTAAVAGELGLYNGGLLGRFATAWGYLVKEGGAGRLLDGAPLAWEETWDGVDPRMCQSQIKLLYEINLRQKSQLFSPYITPDTTVLIMRTQRVDSDPVTNDMQAVDKWVDFYDSHRANWRVIQIPAFGHARITAGIQAGAWHMQQALR